MFDRLKRLFKDFLIYGIGGTAMKVLFILLVPIFTRHLSTSEYGVWSISLNLIIILTLVSRLGLMQATIRFYYEASDKEYRNTVISTSFYSSMIWSFALMAILVLASKNIASSIFRSSEYALVISLVALAAFFRSLTAFTGAVMRLERKSVRYSILYITQALVFSILSIYLVIWLKRGVLGIVFAYFLSWLSVYILFLPQLRHYIGSMPRVHTLGKLLNFGFPFVLSALTTWILNSSDRYILRKFRGLEELGIYEISCTLGMSISLITAAVDIAWPQFAFSILKDKEAKQIYSRVLTYFILIGAFVCLGLSIFAREIVRIFAHPSFYSAYKTLPIIGLSRMLIGMFSILAIGIHIQKQTKFIPVATGGAAALSLISNFLIIPVYGMFGAALTGFISNLTMCMIIYFISQRYYAIKYEFKRIAKILVVCILIYVVSYFIRFNSIFLSVGLKFLAFLTVPFLLYFARFWHKQELNKLRELQQTFRDKVISVVVSK